MLARLASGCKLCHRSVSWYLPMRDNNWHSFYDASTNSTSSCLAQPASQRERTRCGAPRDTWNIERSYHTGSFATRDGKKLNSAVFFVFSCTHTHVHSANKRNSICIRAYIHTCTCHLHNNIKQKYIRMHMHMSLAKSYQANTHTCMHTYMHTYIHIYMHKYIHT